MDKFKYINYEEIILPSESNQDRGFRISFNNIEIRCVLDGHGCNGHLFSEKAKHFLQSNIESSLRYIKETEDLTEYLDNLIFNCEKELKKMSLPISRTTCSILIIRKNKDIWSINLGDSDIYLYTQESIQKLTTKHSIKIKLRYIHPKRHIFSLTDEAKEKHKSDVIFILDDFIENPKPKFNCFLKNRENEYATYINYNKKNIAVSRSLGDFIWKNDGIICKPSISKYPYPNMEYYILIATDGLYDT